MVAAPAAEEVRGRKWAHLELLVDDVCEAVDRLPYVGVSAGQADIVDRGKIEMVHCNPLRAEASFRGSDGACFLGMIAGAQAFQILVQKLFANEAKLIAEMVWLMSY